MSIREIERTTLADYEVLVEAYALSWVDKKFQSAITAWYTVQAGSVDSKGRLIYPTFDKLYDIGAETNRIKKSIQGTSEEPDNHFRTALQMTKNLNKER